MNDLIISLTTILPTDTGSATTNCLRAAPVPLCALDPELSLPLGGVFIDVPPRPPTGDLDDPLPPAVVALDGARSGTNIFNEPAPPPPPCDLDALLFPGNFVEFPPPAWVFCAYSAEDVGGSGGRTTDTERNGRDFREAPADFDGAASGVERG